MNKQKVAIFWFRRDLRTDDNNALIHALNQDLEVLCIFIFDTNILNKLKNKDDARVTFIHKNLQKINSFLKKYDSALLSLNGKPEQIFAELMIKYDIKKVYANHDYEPYAIERDRKINILLKNNDIDFITFKDNAIFEKNDILKQDGKPYNVFSAYMRQWKLKFALLSFAQKNMPVNPTFLKLESIDILSLEQINFIPSQISVEDPIIDNELIKNYHYTRDFPQFKTSQLSIHLRFGTISLAKLATLANQINQVFLNELIWRDFYFMLIYHYPQTTDKCFKPKYENIPWRNSEEQFFAWCNGKTGYPIIDAGMTELNQTGLMHNRVRMLTASFLCKNLLIDWRWGENYFAEKLLDYELSSNIGNWQWAAGTGCDAAPYFRIFNPITQAEKYDNNLLYIKKWIPQYSPDKYINKIVNASEQAKKTIAIYRNI